MTWRRLGLERWREMSHDGPQSDSPGESISRAIRTITIDARGARPIKVVCADGSIREATSADLLASLAKAHEIDSVLRPGALPREILNRRANGLPDLCATCGAELSMSKASRQRRRHVPFDRWRCQGGNCKPRAETPVESCVTCGTALSMHKRSIQKRAKRQGPFRCRKCVAVANSGAAAASPNSGKSRMSQRERRARSSKAAAERWRKNAA